MTATDNFATRETGAPFDRALVALSVRFIETPVERLHEVTQETLGWLGDLCGADRVSLFFVDDAARLSQSAQYWIADGASDRPIDISKLDLMRLPLFRECLQSNEVLAISKLGDIAAHVNEHAILDRLGNKSILMVPIQVAEKLSAALVLSSGREQRAWGEIDLERLSAVGKMIGGAQLRTRSATAATRWTAAFEKASWAVVFSDPRTGRVQAANQAFVELHGVGGDDVVGTSMSEFVVQPCPVGCEEGCEEGLLRRVIHLRGDGTTFPANCSSSTLSNPLGEVTRVCHVLDDSARVQLEQDLLEASARFRALVEASYEGVVITVKGVVVEANEAFGAMFGYTADEVLGMTPSTVTTEEGGIECMRNLRSGRQDPYVVTGVREDGRQFPLQIHGRECAYRGERARVTGFRDLSEEYRAREERERLQCQLRQTQKLESLGVLAGGIAHDFNNLLVAMLGYAELGLGSVAATEPVHGFLGQIRTAAERAAGLTDQMLAYAGKGQLSRVRLNLNELVDEMADLLHVSISKKADLRKWLDPDLPAVLADASQLRQVVMNLLTNASEALGTNSGVLTLRTRTVEVSSSDFAGSPFEQTLRPGPCALLEVTDTGTGMAADTLERIFDPFFTTKFTGRGLGLAAVLGIVRSHSGAVRVRSEPGAGSTFEIFLPAEKDRVVMDADAGSFRSDRLSARVLVVDDEATVRAVTRDLLAFLGADVTTATNGREAVDAVGEQADLDLVLLDLTMPTMGGIEALAHIRELRSGLPVVLMSGYSEVDFVEELAAGGVAGYLKKPFTAKGLRAAVERALAGDGAAKAQGEP